MTSSRGDTWRKTVDRPPADEQELGRIRLRAGSLRRRRRRMRQSGEGSSEGEMMAHPSECSALSYVIARQIDDKVNYCRSLVNARFENSENLYRKDLLSHYGCVNAIEFSNQGDLLVSGEARRFDLYTLVSLALSSLSLSLSLSLSFFLSLSRVLSFFLSFSLSDVIHMRKRGDHRDSRFTSIRPLCQCNLAFRVGIKCTRTVQF